MAEQLYDEIGYRRGYRRRNNVWRELRWFVPALVALPLAAGTLASLRIAPPASSAAAILAPAGDSEAGRFQLCSDRQQPTCIVDGDTIWYDGSAIRIADINAPEMGSGACRNEARMGRRAAARLGELLNAGPFTLSRNTDGADRDRYGRLLRTIRRDGKSLGAVLVEEGLAEDPAGFRRSWC